MKVEGKHYRTIWLKDNDESTVQIIDQRNLPHEFVVEDLRCVDDFVNAIRDMHVRGAPLIGAAAGYGMVQAAREAGETDFDACFQKNARKLLQARPTAVDLLWAVTRQLAVSAEPLSVQRKIVRLLENAEKIADDSVENCRLIGEHGYSVIYRISRQKNGNVVNILTHCNAGWLACVDYGTATAPIYNAAEKGVNIHVWVDETRPRNQGARLTAWELGQQGIPHTIITDNAGGYLMQKGMVDLVLVGSDRTTITGFVANKIGTYLKALAAKDNNVPFYVDLPSSSIDWETRHGLRDIPIEERSGEEVRTIHGLDDGRIRRVLLTPEHSPAKNYAFDITPPDLVTGLITERGICKPDENSILSLFPEKSEKHDQS